MKWELASADRFLEHKEYIDTAIIPLVKVSLAANYKESLELASWVTGIAHALEEQLTGRVMLFPPYTYFDVLDSEVQHRELSTTQHYLLEHNFKYVVTLQLVNEENENRLGEVVNLLQVPYPEEDEEGNLNISKELIETESRKLAANLINLWQK